MKINVRKGWQWVSHRPLVLINLSFLIVILGLFIYLMNKPIDVLENWQVEITDVKNYDGDKPVFNPGDTLVFQSKSVKLINATGTSIRTIICEASSGRDAREIQLDSIPATRPTGVNPPRDNAIVIPDVTQFDGLPRDCYLNFDVCYTDVILWRDHCESNRTVTFTVEEAALDPEDVKRQIEDLQKKIDLLETGTGVDTTTSTPAPTTNNNSTSRTTTPAPVTNNNTTNNTTTNNTTTPPAEEDTGVISSILKFVNGLF